MAEYHQMAFLYPMKTMNNSISGRSDIATEGKESCGLCKDAQSAVDQDYVVVLTSSSTQPIQLYTLQSIQICESYYRTLGCLSTVSGRQQDKMLRLECCML